MSAKKELSDISSREDIHHLVSTFYIVVRQDDLLGPIFDRMIGAGEWPEHIEKLTDFWEINEFGMSAYNGDPREAHRNMDREFDHSITQDHFARWLQIWIKTVDDLYTGEKAESLKQRARRMSTGLYIGIWQGRAK